MTHVYDDDVSIETLLNVTFKEPLEYSLLREVATQNGWDVGDLYYLDEYDVEDTQEPLEEALPIFFGNLYYDIKLVRTHKNIEVFVFQGNVNDGNYEYYTLSGKPEEMRNDIKRVLQCINHTGNMVSNYNYDYSRRNPNILHKFFFHFLSVILKFIKGFAGFFL